MIMQKDLNQISSIIEAVKKQLTNGDIRTAKEWIAQLEALSQNTLDVNLQFQAYVTIAKYYRRIRNYDESAGRFRKALNMVSAIDQKELAKVIIDAHLVYITLETEYNQLKKARTTVAKLLDWLDKNRPDDHLAYGLTYRSLGNIFFADDDIQGGIKQMEKALAYFYKIYPVTHPVTLDVINIISNAYIKIENFESARLPYEKLLQEYQKRNDQAEVASTLLKIGEIYYYTNLKQARSSIMKALKIFEETFEAGHEDIIKALMMLGEIDENIGNYPRAVNYYQKALGQILTTRQNTDAIVVYTYAKIGMILIKMDKLAEAKSYLEEGLTLSENFPNIRLQFLYGLGKIYSFEKNYDAAFVIFREFLQRLEASGHKYCKSYANTLQAIAFNDLEQQKLNEALKHYCEALSIYEKLVSTSCREEKGLAYIRLGYCYEHIEEKDLKKAEQSYEKGFRILDKVNDTGLLEEALAAMIDFYNRTNQPKKRKIYEDKLVKLQTRD